MSAKCEVVSNASGGGGWQLNGREKFKNWEGEKAVRKQSAHMRLRDKT